jgi:hypothetical protein
MQGRVLLVMVDPMWEEILRAALRQPFPASIRTITRHDEIQQVVLSFCPHVIIIEDEDRHGLLGQVISVLSACSPSGPFSDMLCDSLSVYVLTDRFWQDPASSKRQKERLFGEWTKYLKDLGLDAKDALRNIDRIEKRQLAADDLRHAIRQRIETISGQGRMPEIGGSLQLRDLVGELQEHGYGYDEYHGITQEDLEVQFRELIVRRYRDATRVAIDRVGEERSLRRSGPITLVVSYDEQPVGLDSVSGEPIVITKKEVVRIGSYKDVVREVKRFRECVDRRVPLGRYAGHLGDPVRGIYLGLSKWEYLAKSRTLKQSVETGDPMQFLEIMRGILDALDGWHGGEPASDRGVPREMDLLQQYEQGYGLRVDEEEAWPECEGSIVLSKDRKTACIAGERFVNPFPHIKVLHDYGVLNVQTFRKLGHGNLVTRHILVEEGSSDFAFCDFRLAGRHHLLRDCTRLASSLKFEVLKDIGTSDFVARERRHCETLKPKAKSADLGQLMDRIYACIGQIGQYVARLPNTYSKYGWETSGWDVKREYYVALLLDALEFASNPCLAKESRLRAWLSASLLCERLHTDSIWNGHAVLVGVNEYQHLSGLRKSVQDAWDLQSELLDLGYLPTRVTVLSDGDATRDAILGQLHDLKGVVKPDGTVIVSFSGHGARLEKADGEVVSGLCPSNFDPGDLKKTTIWASEFISVLRDIPTKRLIVLLDACHSGGIATVKPGVTPPIELGVAEDFYHALDREGFALLAACKANEVAYEFPGMNNSLFTHYLLEAIEKKADADGKVRLYNLVDYVQERVAKHSGDEQNPWFVTETQKSLPVGIKKPS